MASPGGPASPRSSLPGIFAEIVKVRHPSDASGPPNIDTLRPEYALQRAPYAKAFAGGDRRLHGDVAYAPSAWRRAVCAGGIRRLYAGSRRRGDRRRYAATSHTSTRPCHPSTARNRRRKWPRSSSCRAIGAQTRLMNWRKFSYPAYGATCELHVVDRAEGAIGKPWPAEVNPDAALDGVTYAEPSAALAGTIESLRVKYDPERCPEVARPYARMAPSIPAMRRCANASTRPSPPTLDAYLATWPAVADGAQFSHAADDYLRPRAVAVDIKSVAGLAGCPALPSAARPASRVARRGEFGHPGLVGARGGRFVRRLYPGIPNRLRGLRGRSDGRCHQLHNDGTPRSAGRNRYLRGG